MALVYQLISIVCAFVLGYLVGEGCNDGKWFEYWDRKRIEALNESIKITLAP